VAALSIFVDGLRLMVASGVTATERPKRRHAAALQTGATFGFFAAICVGLLSGCDKQEPLMVSGRVEADTIHIGSKIGGRVEKVSFDEGDQVKVGQPIVELEEDELRAQLAEAEAATSQSQAQLDLLQAGTRQEDILRAEAVVNAGRAELELRQKGFRDEEIREAAAQSASAASELDLTKKELERSQELFKSRTIQQSELDRARSAYETAKARTAAAAQREALMRSGSRPEEIDRAKAQLAQAEADLQRLRNGPRPEEIAAQRAAVAAAAANILRIHSQLDEMKILAPSDAIVETLDLRTGDLVKAGETVAVLNTLRAPYVRCYVPENRLAQVKPGQKVDVTIDSLAHEKLEGTVRRVASVAEFTPRNIQTQEKRSELVFETKVDVQDPKGVLRAGMYADVHIGR